MLNKKGLSTIVATVLIVLLVLAAIAIIWSFISPTFTSGGRAAQIASTCLNIQVKPTSCVYDISAGAQKANVTVELTSDTNSKTKQVGAQLVGATATGDKKTAPSVGGTATMSFTSVTAAPTKAKAFATIADPEDSAKTVDCPAVQEVTCVAGTV